MTSEKDTDDFRYYYTRGFIGSGNNGRVTPSSWDDDTDTEDLTDDHSSSGCLTTRKVDGDEEDSSREDRRQSLARIRRRAQVFSDATNEVNRDWDNLLWDMSDDSVSLICSKICPPSADVQTERRGRPEPVTHSEFFEKRDASRRFDVKLSRIMEVEEASVKSGELRAQEDRGLTRRMDKSSESSERREKRQASSEDDSDVGSDGMWMAAERRTEDEPTMNHAESDYVSKSLKYIFSDDNAKEASSRDELGLGDIFEESARNEYPNTGVPLVSGEGLVTLHDAYNSETSCLPRSGRETFLIGGRDVDSDCFSPTYERCMSSKRYPAERKLTFAARDEYTVNVQILHMGQDGQCGKDSSEDANSAGADSKTPSEVNSRGMRNNDDSRKLESEHTSEDRQRSASSTHSKILLDLDLSDNDDKCSTPKMKAFDDSPQDVENSGNSASPRSILVSGFTEDNEADTRKSSLTEGKLTRAARSPAARSSRLSEDADDCGGKTNKSPPLECCRFGMGDSKWNVGTEIACDAAAAEPAPSDWGDAKPDRCRIKSEWRRLMIELQPAENVFWIDMEERQSRKRFFPTASEHVKMADASCQVPETPRPRIGRYARTKPWKRKRSSWTTTVGDSTAATLRDKLVRSRVNLLENGARTEFLIVPSRSGSSRRGAGAVAKAPSGAFACFRTVFKRLLNAFSVPLNKHGR